MCLTLSTRCRCVLSLFPTLANVSCLFPVFCVLSSHFNSFSTLTTQCRNFAIPHCHPLRGPRTPAHPGITETLQLRLLHCAPMSKASLADSSTNGWGHVRDGNKAAPECPSSCLRDVRSWRSAFFFVKVTAGCIIHCSSPRVMC